MPDTVHVLQSCKIHVTNPKRLSQYLITVRPKEDEKMIAPVHNSEPLLKNTCIDSQGMVQVPIALDFVAAPASSHS